MCDRITHNLLRLKPLGKIEGNTMISDGMEKSRQTIIIIDTNVARGPTKKLIDGVIQKRTRSNRAKP
jgi:hypothetical protein